MKTKIMFRQILAATTAIGLSLPAYAQDVTTGTPPARVGQIAGVSGDVSYNGAGSNGQWVAATANYPITDGDSLFTQAGGGAAVALDASRLTLAPNTELQITSLDAQNFAATASQGEVFLTLTDLQPGQTFNLTTPRGAVSVGQNGEYDVIAGDASEPTTVSVIAGGATVGGQDVPAGQAAYLSGTDQTTMQLGGIQRDDFMSQVLAQMAPPPPPYAPPQVQQMTGVQELSGYGSWDQSPQYGAVWYPNVGSGWAPYHVGHWAFVQPWGWTWVESEPWGFAPFHYGRWIDNDDRWGWVPCANYQDGGYGAPEPPVYAPAVVSFFGLGLAAGITIAALNHGSVGWVPLAPNEAYYPHYHADDDYIRRINRVDVRNVNIVNIHNSTINNYNYNNYANRRAAVYVPADAMARGQPVAHYGHAVDPGMIPQARPIGQDFNQDVRPQIVHRQAAAPQPTDFATRQAVPPMVMPHAPGQGFHPPGGPQFPGQNEAVARPGMPMMQNHPGLPQMAPAQPIRPQNMPEPAVRQQMPRVITPPAPPAYHPPMPMQPAFRPQAVAPPAYHPPMPMQPAQPAFRPQAVAPPAYHPPMPAPQFHPQGAPPPGHENHPS